MSELQKSYVTTLQSEAREQLPAPVEAQAADLLTIWKWARRPHWVRLWHDDRHDQVALDGNDDGVVRSFYGNHAISQAAEWIRESEREA